MSKRTSLLFFRARQATTESGRGPRCNLQGRGKKRDTGGMARGHFIRFADRSYRSVNPDRRSPAFDVLFVFSCR